MGTNLTEKRRHPDFTQTGNSRESKKQRKFADEPNVTMETPEMLQTLMAPHPQPQLCTSLDCFRHSQPFLLCSELCLIDRLIRLCTPADKALLTC